MNHTIEMIATLQAYINHRKGVTIDIMPPTTDRELILLHKMYSHAVNWFNVDN